MVTPASCSLPISVNSASVSPGVREAVGSSMMRRRALRASALAISTSCFSATIRWRTGVSGSLFSPTCASTRAVSARIAASSSHQPRFFSWPRKMF